ncbi:MAG: hypothetical protein AABY55_06960, partial [Candidatus Omnitrophota bacterium]
NVLNSPHGVVETKDGRIMLTNWNDNSLAIIEFEDLVTIKPKTETLRVTHEEQANIVMRLEKYKQFLEEHSVFFGNNRNYARYYLFNTFYMPLHLRDIPQEKINIYLLFLSYNLLALIDHSGIDSLNNKIESSNLTINNFKALFDFLKDIDISLDRTSFTPFLGRWVDLFIRLNKPNMMEARDIFYKTARSHRDLLNKDFDMVRIDNDFARMACLYLRGGISQMLSVEDRIEIQGETVNELNGISLEEVNSVFNEFPEEVKLAQNLEGYGKLLEPIKSQDLKDTAEDIKKSIYGQDKSENLFIREDAQNARDAIITERIATGILQEYYVKYQDDSAVDDRKLDLLIAGKYQGSLAIMLKKRVRILDNLLIETLKNKGAVSRKDAITGLIEEYKNAHIEIRSYISTGANKWIFSIEDPAGMDLSTIVGPLLVLDETTKIGSSILEGILGLGFYTNFVDSDEVWITTGIGDGRFFELKIEHTSDDRWVIRSFRELKGVYKGTRIERIKNFKENQAPDLDAAFVDYNAYRYVAAIQDTDIYYKKRRINEELKLLAEVKTSYGDIRFYQNNSKYQRLARSLLYVEYPKSEEYFRFAPEHFLKLIRNRGITMDLPSGIPLVRTRMTVNKKEIYLPIIQKAAATACLRAMVKLYFEEGQLPPGLSEDYFSDAENTDERGVFKGIREDAENINKDNLDKVDFERYLVKDGDTEITQEEKHRSLKYLVTLIEIKDDESIKISLRGKKEEFLNLTKKGTSLQQITTELGIEGLSQGFVSYITSAHEYISFKNAAGENSARFYSEEEIMNSKELKDFKAFCDVILKHIGMEHITATFYEKAEPILAEFGFNSISWNLYNVIKYTEEFQEIIKGNCNSMDRYNFFHKILDNITHEASHFYDVNKATHESAEELVGLFAWRQKDLIRRFIKSNKNWDDIFKEAINGSPSSPSGSSNRSLNHAADRSI